MSDNDFRSGLDRGADDPLKSGLDDSIDMSIDPIKFDDADLPDFQAHTTDSPPLPGTPKEPTAFDENLFGTGINEPSFGSVESVDDSVTTDITETGTDEHNQQSDVAQTQVESEPDAASQTTPETAIPDISEGNAEGGDNADEQSIESDTTPPVTDDHDGQPVNNLDAHDIDATQVVAAGATMPTAANDVSPDISSDQGETKVFAPLTHEDPIQSDPHIEDPLTSADIYDEEYVDDDEDTKPRKWPWIIALLVLLALIGGIIGYYVYYKDRALPGTTVGAVNISGLKSSEIKTELNKAQSATMVKLTGDIDNKEFNVNELGSTLDVDATAAKALEENDSLLNFVKAPFNTTNIEPIYHLDRSVADKLASQLSKDAPNKVDPVEPAIVLAEDKGEFSVKAGKDGTGISGADLEAAGKKAIISLQSTTADIKFTTVKPRFSNEELQPVVDKANKMATQKVVLKVGSNTVEPGQATQASWITIPELGKEMEPQVKAEAIAAWVQAQADTITVAAKPRTEYVNEQGKTLYSSGDGSDGLEVNNVKDVSSSITSGIESGTAVNTAFETTTVKAPVNRKVIADGAEKLVYQASPGEKWIDINLGARRLTAYVGATPAHAPFDVAVGKPSTPTVVGTFRTYAKVWSQTMKGPGYSIPNVRYVQYFHGEYAIHGAPWSDGRRGPGTAGLSHGCVNMGESDALWVYEWAPTGTVVVTH